ncbi:A protein [Nitrococcus mobilis Nb-231]|uniref:A protein n=1 Tax=Nitrococcus mobilis Nb-231 TaxID=314278 RepID=A4BNS2_9GAMM|nr:A protein [Nitrococcus mobilis Nb-231]
MELEEQVDSIPFSLNVSDDELIEWAKRREKRAREVVGQLVDLRTAYQALADTAQRYGLAPPDPEKHGLEGAVKRLCDEQWWRRKLRQVHAQALEGLAIQWGLVHKRAGIYISDESFKRYQQKRTRNAQLFQVAELINDLGQKYTLAELVALSTASLKNRRNELMARMAGFQKLAFMLGHAPEFYTLTCPSKYHPRHSESCERNKRHDPDLTPKAAQDYLNRLWCRIRAKLKRSGIEVYGFRVAEPHHAGTPHWHTLLFMAPQHVEAVRAIFREHCLAEDGDQPGAEKRRFDIRVIDYSKGTATGYIAKYVAKSVDGHGIDSDLHGHDAKVSSQRVTAWASLWGIRQFQQIGGPPVTVWRQLRRLAELKGIDENPDLALLETARQAADSGDWAAFVEVMNGPTAKRAVQPVKLHKEWGDQPNRYSEPVGYRIIGLACGAQVVRTRKRVWELRIHYRGEGGHLKDKPDPYSLKGAPGDGGEPFTLEDPSGPFRIEGPSKERNQSGAWEFHYGDVAAYSYELRKGLLTPAAARRERQRALRPWSPVNNCTRAEPPNHELTNSHSTGSEKTTHHSRTLPPVKGIIANASTVIKRFD